MLDDEDDRRYDDDDYEDDRPRRRRSRGGRMREEDLDDPVSERANIADLLVTNSRQAAGQAGSGGT